MKVSAIIPAYNEARRIGPVLGAIMASELVDEVIVIDDGSTDKLSDLLVRDFPRVTCVRNKTNLGKGMSMEKGVGLARSEILVFCDSDLVDLTTSMVDSVIRPVLNDSCDMRIGMFSTPSRGFYDKLLSVTAFPSGINSGLRAMRREVWDRLPDYYKRSYYVESGLNYLTYWNFRGPEYELLPYTQVLKERKYGIWEGSFLRWKMNIEVGLAFVRIQFYERFFGFGKEMTLSALGFKPRPRDSKAISRKN